MSIHVREIEYKGRKEYMLYYPGLTEDQAQSIADRINGGYLLDEDRLRQLKAKQKPLSQDQIATLLFSCGWTGDDYENICHNAIIDIVRAIEAAHGITGEQE